MIRRIGPATAGLIAMVLCLLLFQGHLLWGGQGLLDGLERKSLDGRFEVRGPQPITENIVVVTLDDDSLRALGDRLQKRSGFADLVTAIRAAGARVIAIDAIFPDEEHVLPPALARDIDAFVARSATDPALLGPEARALFERVLREEDGDQHLADAFRGNEVVLAIHAGDRVGFENLPADLTKATYGQSVPGARMPYAAHRIMASLPAFHEAAGRIGIATIVVDHNDQSARTLHVGRTFNQRIVMPFSVQIAAAALDIPRSQLAYDAAGHVLHLGDRTINTSDDHAIIINHRGGNDSVRLVRAVDVLEGVVGDALRGAIVIVGYTELGQDNVRTPFATQLPGSALHATIVSNLLRGDLIHRSHAGVDVLLAILLGLGGAGLFSARLPLGALHRVAITLGLAIAWVVTAQLAFSHGNLWLPVVAPLVTLAVAASAGLAVAYGSEGVLRARLRRTFAHYLSDDVIEELLQNPAAVSLGGERRELTVLFSDICGFTTLAEQMEPLQLVRFLNAYFTPMTRAVLDHRGLLDKYIGDAVMAVFGAPVPHAAHADDALDCAITMHARLLELQQTLGRPLQIGIGLNSGEMVVGNMGSAERFDYTVAGDAVNLASRIEGLTRAYGAFCLVGEATRRQASARFRFREIDLVRVKGKQQPAAFFELLGADGHPIVDYVDIDVWDVGLRAWRAGDFDVARDAFTRFVAANPHDRAGPVFLARMAGLTVAPEGWDGVFGHTSK